MILGACLPGAPPPATPTDECDCGGYIDADRNGNGSCESKVCVVATGREKQDLEEALHTNIHTCVAITFKC